MRIPAVFQFRAAKSAGGTGQRSPQRKPMDGLSEQEATMDQS